jgi:hypothetical protein
VRRLATVSDVVEAGAIARDEAEMRLLTRGLDPAAHARLLDALQRAIEQVVAAHEHGRDTGEYRAYLDELYARLDADPVVDGLPEPPRRTLALRW